MSGWSDRGGLSARRLFGFFQSAHRAIWSRQRAAARCSGVGPTKSYDERGLLST